MFPLCVRACVCACECVFLVADTELCKLPLGLPVCSPPQCAGGGGGGGGGRKELRGSLQSEAEENVYLWG